MAAGTIITVLSNIPWGQVLESAPKVADAAEKLWNAVINRKKGDQQTGANAKNVVDAAQSDTEILKSRLSALEEHVLSLEDQMSASTELIKTLAEQNSQLVRRVELNRTHLLWLAVTVIIVVIALAGPLAFLLLRQ